VTDWTAITGIVVSGAFGPAIGATLASRHQRRQLEFEAIAQDKAELRALLDQVIEATERADERFRDLDVKVFGAHLEALDRDDYAAALSAFREELRAIALLRERLRIRIGLTPGTAFAFERIGMALADADSTLAMVMSGADPGVELGNLSKAHTEFTNARSEFRRSALQIVGSRLGPTPSAASGMWRRLRLAAPRAER
jgi:hypothetical protein